MSARQANTHFLDTLSRLRDFAARKSGVVLPDDERGKLRDLRGDVARLGVHGPSYRWSCFGSVFSWFERSWSLRLRHIGRDRSLPALDEDAMRDARPHTFAADYETFDALSVRYGGLFRGSVIVNYVLGVVAVAVTVATVLPPRIIAPLPDSGDVPEFAHWATWIELVCIVGIFVVFCYGRTPHAKIANRGSRRHGFFGRIARRWRERWLEYRLLAERFRYIELLLAISPSANSEPPFETSKDGPRRWYDEYFAWRTKGAQAKSMSARDYRKQALALMVEQVEHHAANSERRGSIAERLERFAVGLFFLSLVLCAIALVGELTPHCPTCTLGALFNDKLRPLIFFGAVLVPTLSAAIHGILATTEYTKLAESSRETAARIKQLADTIKEFCPGDGPATPEALAPIQKPVTAFADAAINEASGWRATLHDKNVPLA